MSDSIFDIVPIVIDYGDLVFDLLIIDCKVSTLSSVQ